MRIWFIASILAVLFAQSAPYRAPRGPDGKPNLSGVWQAINTANWDLEGHAASQGPVPLLGAVFSVPPGLGVVEGETIPYLPASAANSGPSSTATPISFTCEIDFQSILADPRYKWRASKIQIF